MKFETLKTPTDEIYAEHDNCAVTVTRWGNCEGANIMVLDNCLHLRMACALRYEEIDLLIAALAVSRAL